MNKLFKNLFQNPLCSLLRKKLFKNTKFLYVELLLFLSVIATFSVILFTSIIHINETNKTLKKQSNVVSQTLDDLFNSVTNIIVDIGEKFEKEKPSSKQAIEKFLLKNSEPLMTKIEDKDHKLHNIFTYHSFGWISDRFVVVPNRSSVSLNYEYHPEYKKLIEKSKTTPCVIHFSTPQIGFASGLWGIFTGLGLVGDHSEFLGTLSIGLNIAAIEEKIQNRMDDHFYFIVSDLEGNIIFQSHILDSTLNHSTNPQSRLKKIVRLSKLENKLEKPLEYNSIIYSYYKKMGNYPYVILVGFDKKQIWGAFFSTIWPKILEFWGMSLFCGFLLYLSRRRIIRTTKDSDRIKSEFISALNHNISKPLQSAVFHCNVLSKYLEGKFQQESKYLKMKSIIEIIQNEILNIYTVSSSYLNLTDININQLILDSIKMTEKDALISGVEIFEDLHDVPIFIGDNLRIKQILLSLIKKSVEFSPKGSEIHIRTSFITDKQNKFVQINIHDHSFGFSWEEMDQLKDKLTNKNILDKDFQYDRTLSLEEIQKIISIHNGTYSFSSTLGKGNSVVIRFLCDAQSYTQSLSHSFESKNVHHLFPDKKN